MNHTQPIRSPQALSARTVPNGLLLPDNLPFEQWLNIGQQLSRKANHIMWALADWLFYGEWEYGQRYKAGAELTGLDESTLRKLKHVAGRFTLTRRRNNLSFAHHAEVAALPEPQQDQWLDKAAAEGWSLHRLRAERQTPTLQPTTTTTHTVYRINATPKDNQLFTQAATQAGLTVDAWLLQVARQHAQLELAA